MKYNIIGEPMPVVICDVDPGETLITESGSMSWMSPNMQMQTTTNGGLGKAFGRMFSGESMFQNKYTAAGGPGQIAFASSFPGSIRALEVNGTTGYIMQKGSFLAGTEGVTLSVHMQKKLGAGLFGGEGFIMQKLSGNGIAFVEIDGHAVEYELAQGQSMVVGTGHLAYITDTCTIEIKSTGGAKNAILGGEGFFNTVIHGPGKVVLQSMPVYKLAHAVQPYLVSKS
ncbi:MAG: TIGR00266 family protein [Clostridia bacterium]|nr:TIGR00266 family protein [Clostridia bacterium]